MHGDEEASEAKVHVVGIGEYGLQVVNKIYSSSLPSNSIPFIEIATRVMWGKGNQSFHALYTPPVRFAPPVGSHQWTILLRDNINDTVHRNFNDFDLVYIVAGSSEDSSILETVCRATKAKGAPTYLIIPEGIVQEIVSVVSAHDVGATSLVDGIFIVSNSSMAPPYLYKPDNITDNKTLNYFAWFLTEQLYQPLANGGLIGVDLADLQCVVRGSLLRFGTGIKKGQDRALNALEEALCQLAAQGIELKRVASIWCVVNGSSASLTSNEFVQVSNKIHSEISEDCIIRVLDANDDSLGDSLMVSVIAGFDKIQCR